MKVFLALLPHHGQTLAARPEGRVLCSFFMYGGNAYTQMRARLPAYDVFIDSGAFSAVNAGPIDPNEYIAWAFERRHDASAIAAPDVIGDPAATAKATETMLARFAGDGAPVLPVFHVGSDWKHLDRCIAQSDYIALGGMVPFYKKWPALIDWVAACFRRIPPHVKVHGFGCTRWSLVRGFPWASVDSSSWANPSRYGLLVLFDERAGEWREVMRQDNRRFGKPVIAARHLDVLREYGVPLRLLTTDQARSKEAVEVTLRATAEAWARAEKWLNARNGTAP